MSPLSLEHELEALQVQRLRLHRLAPATPPRERDPEARRGQPLGRHRLDPSRPLRDARAAAAFVRERAIVMETGSSGLPVLAEAIVGRQIRGSWMADRGVYRVHRILNGTKRHGVVAAPIVLGKETLFVPAPGPALARLASDEARRAYAGGALPAL